MEKYLSEAYISKTRDARTAVKWAYNKHNLGKVRIFMIDGEQGTYGVVPNALAKKFKAAGYEELPWDIEKMLLSA